MKGQEFKAKIIIFLSIIFLCFAVFSCDSTGIPPDIPTGVRAKSGDEGVTIGWDWGLFQGNRSLDLLILKICFYS